MSLGGRREKALQAAETAGGVFAMKAQRALATSLC